tara:strand:+ start:3452 stop:3865 length:414 start_codon:yes stop_codon:yes gene_type:complete
MTKLIEMLKRHEGVRNHIYTDSLGYQTIGVGRNIQNGISDKEIDFLLLNDMERVISELENNFNWFSDMEWARRDAIINIAFNLGITRLLLFKKALNAMSQKDYSKASNEFMDSLWSQQVGSRAVELCDMIENDEYYF